MPLRIEALEDRTAPAALGSPWPDPGTLTLSFAADGTRVGEAASDTATAFAGVPAAVWQREVLRAFQTWAVQIPANVALVADGGQAFGTPGPAQGDFRFGDVRVGAVPLSDDSLANASAFDWSIGTWSGDVLFNTRARFAAVATPTAADVFTVALHEAGHVFGMEHSNDPTSAMSENYTGPKTGLSAADIDAVRSYYGARQPDAHERVGGNGSRLTATPVDAVLGSDRLTADIGPGDTDVYSLLNASQLGQLEVRVRTSGVSLLAARVEITDRWGRLVAAGTATGPGQDVTLDVPQSLVKLGCFVTVTGATGDVFAVGGYEVSVARTSGLTLPPQVAERLIDNTPRGAAALDGRGAGADGFAADANVDSSADVDVYTVRVPPTTNAAPRAMVVSVTNLDGKAHPELAVLDAAGRSVPFQVLASSGGVLTIQVTQVPRGGAFYVRVSNPAGADATGRYRLTADFHPPVEVRYSRLAAGRLTTAAPAAATGLTVNNARLFEFVLVSTAADGAATGGATLTVRDAAGKVVLTLVRDREGATNRAVYLAPGVYTVTISASPGATNYWAGVREVSDPAGPYDPGTSTTYPEQPPPDDGNATGAVGEPLPPAEPAPVRPAGDESLTFEAPAPPPWYYGF
ncbi:matrixin family metalloprotease [Urbifossiella limnaea]|uniref:Matrixin n=1 Tax=Urbifossiella limnaea TaxID=2528023 RepID=A0A517XYN1_9BACT|nr:matrixin family metalloprotease [Urbifossiella limnaea]QDU22612.1 Matrixin [Urbifossiella limnaea]